MTYDRKKYKIKKEEGRERERKKRRGREAKEMKQG